MAGRMIFSFFIIGVCCCSLLGFAASKIPQEEADALREITTALGAQFWDFNEDTCEIRKFGVTLDPPKGAYTSTINCSCNVGNDTFCHVIAVVLKGYSLPGILPPQLAKLQYLQKVDFSLNFLTGTIPAEWASLQLTYIALLVNRLSGELPKMLGNITSLTYLVLSSNNLTGSFPISLAGLTNLTDFRINDNNFNGTIPTFITNWKHLTRLELHASGLEGPIPTEISTLSQMTIMKISDINGPGQTIPVLSNMTSLQLLVMRSCNLSGEIPSYLWTLDTLEMLDVSFNKLVGRIPPGVTFQRLRFIFLSGNLLSGPVPNSVLKDGVSLDLSYNNFIRQTSLQPTCQKDMNLNLNLFRSSSPVNDLSRVIPCLDDFHCHSYSNCLHVNCGGEDIKTVDYQSRFLYQGDGNDKLVYKNFDIELVAGGALRSVVDVFNVTVTDNILDIRLYFAGKGTTRIPRRGVYGPLISAISVVSDTKVCSSSKKGSKVQIAVGVGVGAAAVFILAALLFLWWKCNPSRKAALGKNPGMASVDQQTAIFTLKQIKEATNNFSPANKIGEGGFGPVFKACHKQKTGGLLELMDKNLKDEVDPEEIDLFVKIAILCTNVSPSVRPTMSEVVKMLEGEIPIPEVIPTNYTEDLRFTAVRDLLRPGRNQDYTGSQTRMLNSLGSSFAYSQQFIEILPELRQQVVL
ncbi:hypothetical protein SAY86_010527 [Trapa natans]|uniref:non-specific serine/threonine protein kinase n=1 Tax=Trapa natans TaxID=22666 RepID=A0AAN7R095_TRANT|nr:hypothetical protein SAY86_010527 [Trapa natans]